MMKSVSAEKMMKSVSAENVSEINESYIDKNMGIMMVNGPNETMGKVLEFFQEAKNHDHRKGEDLLDSVLFVGKYLAESLFACMLKALDLLEYLLSIKGEDEPRPFYSVLFMLPLLSQITTSIEGCKTLASTKGLQYVVDCLIKMMDAVYGSDGEDTSGSMVLASDVIEHVLLITDEVDWSCVGRLLKTLECWIDSIGEASMDIRVAGLHALIMDSITTEDLIDALYD